MKAIYQRSMLRGVLSFAVLLGVSAAYAAPQTYQVVAGDTLTALSKRYNVSIDNIAKANKITPKTTIVIGDTLTIPSSSTAAAPAKKPTKNTTSMASYQIASGDTLTAIAKRYGVSVAALVQATDMTAANTIRAGDTLLLPKNAKAVKSMPVAATPTPMVSNTTITTPAPTASSSTKPVATAVVTSGELPDTYTVQAGDTLMGIANRYGLKYTDIALASGIDPSTTLQIGQVLRLTPAASQETAMSMVDDDIY